MARTTTTIKVTCDPEGKAREAGNARQARLGGETVWFSDNTQTAFIMQPQALAIGLCMYRWCTKKAIECKRHAAVRGRVV